MHIQQANKNYFSPFFSKKNPHKTYHTHCSASCRSLHSILNHFNCILLSVKNIFYLRSLQFGLVHKAPAHKATSSPWEVHEMTDGGPMTHQRPCVSSLHLIFTFLQLAQSSSSLLFHFTHALTLTTGPENIKYHCYCLVMASTETAAGPWYKENGINNFPW